MWVANCAVDKETWERRSADRTLRKNRGAWHALYALVGQV